MSGPDVLHAQQLLAANPFADFRPGTADGIFGPASAEAVRRAKLALGYPDKAVDASCGPTLLAFLEGTRPLPGGYRARAAARATAAAVPAGSASLRDAVVAVARWGIANEAQIHYEQRRPIDGIDESQKLPLHTDCSGFVTLCHRWAGAPDPNGRKFDGQGYTGTILQACRQIALNVVQPGDLVVWGAPPGHHVALVLEAGPDPLLVSHGSERGPYAVRFSEAATWQPAPATWLTCLP